MKPLVVKLATPVNTLVLIGGGEFSFGETRAIDELLVSRMPAERPTVAFIPAASGSSEYARHFGAYLQQIDPALTVVNVPIYRGRDSRRQKNLDLLMSAGMIYIGGGVTNNLLDTMRDSPADLAMRDAAANGAVIAAIGAGASSFGIHARDMRGAGAIPGLGWLAGAAVDAPFNPDDDKLRRLMSLPEVELGIGVPTSTALVISSGGTTDIAGSGTIAVFRKA